MVRASLGELDRRLLDGASSLIGVDEVGRGCLAGPLVVGAVRFSFIPDNPAIQDSKSLTPRMRDQAASWVKSRAEAWLVVEVWVETVDRLNVLEATRVAMRSAARALLSNRDRSGTRHFRAGEGGAGSVVVIDNVDLGDGELRTHAVKAADARYFTVAAASIIAKVHRDRLMVELGRRYPHWGWEDNKGYGTRRHRQGLTEHGQSFLHRSSFRWSPVLP